MHKSVLMAQIDVQTGALKENTQKIKDIIQNNIDKDFIVFPEMTISGYNCGDLFEMPEFISECYDKLEEIKSIVGDTVVILGLPRYTGKYLRNSAAIIHNGQIVDFYDKILLANDSHHEDSHYFKSGTEVKTFYLKETHFSVLICEDLWYKDHTRNLIAECNDKCNELECIFSLNFSYFTFRKLEKRKELVNQLSLYYYHDIFYVNSCSIGDILKNYIIYDGASMHYSKGELVNQSKQFSEDVTNSNNEIKTDKYSQIYNALIYSISKIFKENNLKKALVSVSGGIDSLVVGTLVTHSLGENNVVFITTPTNNNSQLTYRNVLNLAKKLKVELVIEPIQKYVDLYKQDLGNKYKPLTVATFEADFRTVTCLSLCNERGLANIGCGNLDESYNGFFAFGDPTMTSSFQPIDDLTKKEIFNLAEYINKNFGNIIPENMYNGNIKPMAELEDQMEIVDGKKTGKKDPIDYVLASGICSALLRGKIHPKTLIKRCVDYYNGCKDEEIEYFFNEDCVYDKRKLKDFELKYIIDQIILTYQNNLKSIYKGGCSALNIMLAGRTIGFSYRKPIISHYKYFDDLKEYGHSFIK